MKKETKKILIVISSLIVGLFYIITAASFYFYKLAIKRSYKAFMHKNKNIPRKYHKKVITPEETTKLEEVLPASNEQSGEGWVEAQAYETWNITSEDDLKLVGFYIPANIRTNKTVILAHGYSSKGKNMGDCAKLY